MASAEMGELSLKFTADIADILTKVEAMQSKLKEFQKGTETSLKGIADGMEGLRGVVEGLEGGFSGILGIVEKFAGPVGAIVASVGGIAGAMTAVAIETANATNELRIQAAQAGTSTDKFLAFRAVMEEIGVGGEMAARQMAKLNEDIALAADSTSKQALAFKQLKISVGDGVDSMQTMIDTLSQIGRLTTEQQKIAALTDLFGQRQARLMLPTLAEITAKYQHMQDVIAATGAGPSEFLKEQAETYRRQVTELGLAWEGLKNKIAEAALPILNEIIPAMTTWIAQLTRAKGFWETMTVLMHAATGGYVPLPPEVREPPKPQEIVGPPRELAPPDTYSAKAKAAADAALAALQAYNAEIARLDAMMNKLDGDQNATFNSVVALIEKARLANHAFTLDQQESMLAKAREVDLTKQENARLTEQQKYMEEIRHQADTIAQARARIADNEKQFVAKLDEEQAKQQRQLDLIGAMPEVVARINAEESKRAEIEAKILDYQQQAALLANTQPEASARAAAAAANLAAQEERRVKIAGDTAEAIVRQNQLLREQQALWNTIAGWTEQFFTDLFTKGTNAFKNLGESLKKYFISLLAQLIEKQFVVPILLSFSSTGGIGQAGLAALGGGTGPLGQISSLLSGAGGAGGLGGIFGGGGATAAEIAAAGGDYVTAAEGAAAAAEGLGLTLGSLIPVVGLAVAAFAAYEYFAANKPPSEVQGQLAIGGGPFEDAESVASKYFGAVGFLDASTKYFSGKAALVFDKVVADALDAVGSRLSTEQIASVAAKLQASNLPTFSGTTTTEDFLQKYGGQVLSQVLSTAIGELDSKLGDLVGNFKGSADETVAFANSLLTFYDVAQKLPDAVHADLEAAIQGTQESIDNITKIATAAAMIFNADNANALADAQAALAAGSRTAYEAFQMQGDALADLISKTDSSAAAAQALAKATGDYYLAEVKLLAQIEQIKGSLSSMLGDTIEQIKTSTMTSAEKYTYYQSQAQALEKQLEATTDPQKIDELTSKINDLISKAYGLLTPEQQAAAQQQFIDSLNHLNEIAQAQLDQASSAVQSDAQAHLDDAAAKMTDVAAQMAAAATKQQQAADEQLAAARTPKQVNVTVQVDPQTSEVGYYGGAAGQQG